LEKTKKWPDSAKRIKPVITLRVMTPRAYRPLERARRQNRPQSLNKWNTDGGEGFAVTVNNQSVHGLGGIMRPGRSVV